VKTQEKPDKPLKMLSSKIEDFFDFTTFFTTFGSKDMPSYAVICHQGKDGTPLRKFQILKRKRHILV
jgi:hypothetical protein